MPRIQPTHKAATKRFNLKQITHYILTIKRLVELFNAADGVWSRGRGLKVDVVPHPVHIAVRTRGRHRHASMLNTAILKNTYTYF